MKVYLGVVLLCLLACDNVFGRNSSKSNSRKLCPNDVRTKQCPLLEVGSNIVTQREFMSMMSQCSNSIIDQIIVHTVMSQCTNSINDLTPFEIATGHWLDIYSVGIGDPPVVGKSDTRWRQTYYTVTRDISFLGPENTCMDVSINLLATETKCGVQLNQVGGDRIERFYSQDLAKYFWWYICLEPTNEGQGCNKGYFDLQIRDTRAVSMGEINLAGLPWGKIAADLKHIRKVGIGDINGPDYIWLGKECPLP